MGSSVRGWRSAGWQSTVVRVVCVEGLGRAECWARFVHLSGYWCLSCVWASRLESLPPLGDILVFPSLCSQGAALDLTQTDLCSLTRHESEVRGEVRVAVGEARLHLTAASCQVPFPKGSCTRGSGVVPHAQCLRHQVYQLGGLPRSHGPSYNVAFGFGPGNVASVSGSLVPPEIDVGVSLKAFSKFLFFLNRLGFYCFVCPMCPSPTSDTEWLFLRGI